MDLYSKIIKAINEGIQNALSNNLVTEPIQLYHLSKNYLDGEILTPRVPLRILDGEDNSTPRVCFSSTIAGAYRAMNQFGGYCDIYVYEPENIDELVNNGNVIKCDETMVPDVNITNEYWVTCPVKVRLIKKIRIGYNGDLWDYKDGVDKWYKLKTHFKTIKENFGSGYKGLEHKMEKLFEGSWGYEPNNSDSYWDWSHHLTKNLKEEFIKGLKDKDYVKQYSFMGFINGFIQNKTIWLESIDKEYGYKLYDLFKKDYDIMSAKDSEFAKSWRDEQMFRDQLEIVWADFNKHIKQYIGVIIPKDLRNSVEGPIEDLYTDDYIAKRWDHYFKVKKTGKVYYTETGPDCSEQDAKWETYHVELGKIQQMTKEKR